MRRQMKCHTIEKKISAYQDGELSASEKEKVARHLADCHSCREQYARLQRMWQVLGDQTEIGPTPGFYKRVSQKIDQTPEKSVLGPRWRNWGLRALPSPVFASVILAIGMLCGTYIGNYFIKIQPFHNVAAYPEEGFLSSLKVFDPVPPGSLADNYERLLSYNEGHIR
jgi:predicted anti-sigma-YlaC factor YlaD